MAINGAHRMMTLEHNKEEAYARETAEEIMEVLPENRETALRVLEYLWEMIELPEPVGAVANTLLAVIGLV
jgi:hypothetical protein